MQNNSDSEKMQRLIEKCRHEDAATIVGITYLLGMPSKSNLIVSDLDILNLVEIGFPGRAIKSLHKKSGLCLKEISEGLAVPEYRLNKIWQSQYKRDRLLPWESAIVWQFSELFVRTTRLMGSKEFAREWLLMKRGEFKNRRPIDLMSTPVGAAILRQFLGRLAHGVFI